MDSRLLAFQRLLDIMDELRQKCPWDSKQTLESLRHLTIEETFELSDAVIENDLEEIRKELGDLMLHIVFYAKIAEEQKAFDIQGVLEGITEKLIRRHPHIFSDVKADTVDEIKANWEQIKLQEGAKTVLGGVPKSLPAMIKAQRIQEKARGAGFDWDHRDQVFDKVCEEIHELKNEIQKGNVANIEAEFGDVFFSLINYARFIDVNPENALEKTNRKFIARFNYLEQQAKVQNRKLSDMTLAEMEEIWQEAKRKL